MRLLKNSLNRFYRDIKKVYKKKMRGSEFEFDGIHLLYYGFNKISLNRGGSYIESAKWINDIKSIINPKSNDYKCFQNAVTIALNHDKHLAYKSKHNLTHEKQVILLMIADGEKWHYTAVTRLSGLLRGVTGNNNGDFYCLNCFHAFRTENKLEKHKKICENHDYCRNA